MSGILKTAKKEKNEEKSKSNVILDDYIKLIRCSSPFCNCGKCIIRKYSNKPNPFKSSESERREKNYYEISKNNFYKKEKENPIENRTSVKFENRNKANGLINMNVTIRNNNTSNDKELIKKNKENKFSNLEKEKEEDKETEKHEKNEKEKDELQTFENPFFEKKDIYSRFKIIKENRSAKPPFIGHSSYKHQYPDWNIPKPKRLNNERKVLSNVPFNGNSSYKDNFSLFEKRYYLNKPQPILKSDTLENRGEIMKESISRERYRPINFNKHKNLGVVEIKRPSSIIPAPYSKDSFLSSYERAFMFNNIHSTAKKEMNDSYNYNSDVICD